MQIRYLWAAFLTVSVVVVSAGVRAQTDAGVDASVASLREKEISEAKKELEDRHQEAVLKAEASASPLTLYDLLGTFVSWIALMQLLSIAVERAVSFTKRARILARRRPLRVLLGPKLVDVTTYDADKLSKLIVLLGGNPPPRSGAQPADSAVMLKALVDADAACEDDVSRREAALRGLSLFFGLMLAWSLNIDTIALLRPILPKSFPDAWWLGIVLSGFASAAGSAFWNDFLDRLTAWKKSAKDAGAPI